MLAMELKQWLYSYFLFTQWILYDGLIGVHNYCCDCSIRVFQPWIQWPEKWPDWAKGSTPVTCMILLQFHFESRFLCTVKYWCSKSCCTYISNKKKKKKANQHDNNNFYSTSIFTIISLEVSIKIYNLSLIKLVGQN